MGQTHQTPPPTNDDNAECRDTFTRVALHEGDRIDDRVQRLAKSLHPQCMSKNLKSMAGVSMCTSKKSELTFEVTLPAGFRV